MWLLLRKPRSSAVLDLNRTRIWHTKDDPYFGIDFSDGQLHVSFESVENASVAIDRLLVAIRDEQAFLDTSEEDWGAFTAEWRWFDPDREDFEPDPHKADAGTLPAEDNQDTDEGWGLLPPIDPELRSLWDLVEPVRNALRPKRSEVELALIQVCQERYLSADEIGEVFGRPAHSFRIHFINPMVKDGRLRKEFGEKRSHPNQRYTASTNENMIAPSAE